MATKKALFVEGNRDVKSIVCLDKEKAIKFNKDSKRAGESFRRYRYNGIVFIIAEEEGFLDVPTAEKAYVKLLEYTETIQDDDGNDVNVERLEFDSFGLKTEDLAEREHEVAMESIGKNTVEITDTFLAKMAQLEQASAVTSA